MNKKAIEQQLALRYAQIVDDRDFAAMNEIMASDFKQKGPGFEANSASEFIAGLEILRQYSATFHLLGNQLGEWQEDSYQGETYCVASHLYEKDGVSRKLDMGIRYKETIANIEGDYKYTRRDLDIVWTQDLPVAG